MRPGRYRPGCDQWGVLIIGRIEASMRPGRYRPGCRPRFDDPERYLPASMRPGRYRPGCFRAWCRSRRGQVGFNEAGAVPPRMLGPYNSLAVKVKCGRFRAVRKFSTWRNVFGPLGDIIGALMRRHINKLRQFERFQTILRRFAARTGSARPAVVECEAGHSNFSVPRFDHTTIQRQPRVGSRKRSYRCS